MPIDFRYAIRTLIISTHAGWEAECPLADAPVVLPVVLAVDFFVVVLGIEGIKW